MPAANQAIIVTTRAHDPDGLGSIQLNYRIDPNANYTTLNMVDNGTGGDAIAGDGLYSATIPGQTNGTMIAFFIQAADSFSPVSSV